jgi:GTP-binding protein
MPEVKFVKSIVEAKDKPKLSLPEIVLCGRSNVGKSSFINSFFNRKNLAKVSSTPGKTRLINYYSVDDKFYIVDLPGFGYAKAPKTEQAKWEEMITNFLLNSKDILFAFHFIDSRHKPTNLDVLLRDFLNKFGIDTKIIITKTDKLKQSELAKAKENIKEFLNVKFNEADVFLYSAVKGTGKNEIKKFLSKTFGFKI